MLLLEISDSKGEHEVQDKYFKIILEKWKKGRSVCRII